jgi:hypothetical protein
MVVRETHAKVRVGVRFRNRPLYFYCFFFWACLHQSSVLGSTVPGRGQDLWPIGGYRHRMFKMC